MWGAFLILKGGSATSLFGGVSLMACVFGVSFNVELWGDLCMGGHVCGSVWALSRTCALMPGSHRGSVR